MADARPNQQPEPTDEQLLAFAAGELAGEQARAVAAYVEREPWAAAMVAAYRAARHAVESDDSVAPPKHAVERAKAIFHSRVAKAARPGMLASWMESVDRFMAKIIYDSRLQPAAVRFADPSAQDRINLTFETEAGEVDVQAERVTDVQTAHDANNQWRIMGQISESKSTSTRRELALLERDSSEVVGHWFSDEHGAFALDASSGEYELLLRSGDRAIVLTPIVLT
jgi:hypothetical protein